MDGNGRWAKARSWPRVAGHREGAKAVRRVIEAAPDLGIGTLTLYAFSSDNWKRPSQEVRALMSLFRRYLRSETRELVEKGARLSIVGRTDRLPEAVQKAVLECEHATRSGKRLHVRLAIDYSGRDALLEAARGAMHQALESGIVPRPGHFSRQDFTALLAKAMRADAAPDVDLLIRTGGEQRISDFLLWESAYAELHFTQRMWPDFDAFDLATAVADFRTRQRRFGEVPEVEAVPAPAGEPEPLPLVRTIQ